jgi:hypothetical protein
MQNGSADVVPGGATGSKLQFALDGYTPNSVDFSLEVDPGLPWKAFTQLPVRVDRMFIERAGGTLDSVYGGPSVEFTPYFPLDATLYAGRSTSVAVKLNDGSLTLTPTGPALDRTVFEQENLDPVEGEIQSFLSDFVSFDISNVPAGERPLLNNGSTAATIHFSGDNVGLSNGFDTADSFNMLFANLTAPDTGKIVRPVPLGDTVSPGTWTLLEPDPRDPLLLPQITSLLGTWRPHTEVLRNVPEVAMLILPNSRRTGARTIVLFRTQGGRITSLWHGTAQFSAETGTHNIEVFPIRGIREADVTGSITGTLTVNKLSSGLAKSGTFTLASAPAGIGAATGNWLMFTR